MLFSIGYQKIGTPLVLIEELQRREVDMLMDVRSKPYSKWKEGFNMEPLRDRLAKSGICYLWRGKTLGGFAPIGERAIADLVLLQTGRAICLMCLEADPVRCHRKYEIARRLKRYGVAVDHIIT